MEELRRLVERLEGQERERREEVEKALNEYREKLKTVEDFAKIAEPKREDVERLFSVLCFGNLGYCCGLEKPCPFRDAVLEALRISPETYRRMKEDFGFRLAKLSSPLEVLPCAKKNRCSRGCSSPSREHPTRP